MRRAVVTGIGSHNAFGAGVPAFLEGLRSGGCAIGPMTVFPTDGYRTRRAAVAPEVEAGALGALLGRRLAARVSRADRMALAAAREAWQAAGAASDPAEPARFAVVVGGTTGGILEAEEGLRRRTSGEEPRLGLRRVIAMPVSSTADVLAAAFGAEGPRTTISTACSSSASAIGVAADLVRDGRADVVLAGGTEAHCRMTFAGFNALQALDPDVCRPFDRRRAGLSLGEGAAFLVVEDEARARRRGAEILGEVAGHGTSADAHHMTAPAPTGAGAVAAMRAALDDARVRPEEVDYVNAHGTGTPANDPIETRAVRAVFGERAARLPVSSTKSQVGHCLGAAGAVEIVATLLGMRHGFVPPTVHLDEPDPECDLDYVAREARAATIRVAISNSYGFGGNNTCVVLRAP